MLKTLHYNTNAFLSGILLWKKAGDHMREVIKVEQLTKSYNQLLVVNNLSLSVRSGTVFVRLSVQWCYTINLSFCQSMIYKRRMC